MRLLRAVLGLAAALSLGAVRPAASQQAPPHGPPPMLHPAAGKQDCLSCHGRGANEHITSVPAGHSYGNGACAMCHKPIAATPKSVPHPLDDAHADCRKCHVQAAEGATPGAGGRPRAAGVARYIPRVHLPTLPRGRDAVRADWRCRWRTCALRLVLRCAALSWRSSRSRSWRRRHRRRRAGQRRGTPASRATASRAETRREATASPRGRARPMRRRASPARRVTAATPRPRIPPRRTRE